MSDTYLQTVPRAEPLQPASSRLRPLGRIFKWIFLLVILAWIAAEGASLVIQHTSLRRELTARIEASFGRPVEVGSYDFSFWRGPALEAHSVTVADDPRFGSEYFLRAESMTFGLRWQSLLRGRIDLGTLSLIRPSLNLVRNSDGEWNLAEWLPRPGDARSASAPVGPSLPSPALSFRRIEVDGGRINFKRGDEKLPLALVEVSGAVETGGPGRWRMNLDAAPWRAAIVLQQMGVIHVSGDVGGTSSRLRPATLDVTWTAASLSDVLRLAFGNDDGIRGDLALAINAHTQDQGAQNGQEDGWTIQGRSELRQIHRWDLAIRPDNPSVNLITRMEWRPSASSIELKEVALESLHSNAHGSGHIFWNPAAISAGEKSAPVQFAVSGSQVDLGDLLAWVRAFRPGVAETISASGTAGVRADVSGWPLRLVTAAVSSDGVNLSGLGPRSPVHLGPIQLHEDHGAISFLPIALSWGGTAAAPGSLSADPSVGQSPSGWTFLRSPARKAISTWHVAGKTAEARDLITGASALGWNISSGWNLAGAVRRRLAMAGNARHVASWRNARQSIGWIEFGGSAAGPGDAALSAPFLNRPVERIKARAEWKSGTRHIAIASAQAFGARWSGTFDRRDPVGDWQFALSADRLAAADLDRSLNPQWRESFLDRMLPFLNSRSPSNAVPEALRASGHLALAQFTLEPFDVRHLDADLQIEGRHIALAKASGQLYGGAIDGLARCGLGLRSFLRHEPEFFSRGSCGAFG